MDISKEILDEILERVEQINDDYEYAKIIESSQDFIDNLYEWDEYPEYDVYNTAEIEPLISPTINSPIEQVLPSARTILSGLDNIINLYDNNGNVETLSIDGFNILNTLTNGNIENMPSLHDIINIVDEIPELSDIIVSLDEADIEKMPITKYNRDDKNNCIICQELFIKDISDIRTTPCNHFFHPSCIDEWLKKFSNKCPICRTELGEGKPRI